MPTLASKMIEVHGKQIDVRLLTGALRIRQDCYRAPYKYISYKTSLSMYRVREIMEDIESVARFLFKGELEQNMNYVSRASTEKLAYTVISKIIEDNDQ